MSIWSRKIDNVGVRVGPKKRGREVCLYRVFEDAGGVREFTLWLSMDEAEHLADMLDDMLNVLRPLDEEVES